MSLLYVHGFDNVENKSYVTNLIPGWIDTAYWEPSGTVTRFGSGKSMAGIYYTKYMRFTVAPKSTLVVGFAVYSKYVSLTNNSTPFITFYTPTNSEACHIEVGPDLSVSLWRSTISMLGASVGGIFETRKWNYFEIKIVFGNSTAGSCEIRKNGVEVLNITGVDTVYDLTGGTTACHILFDSPNSSATEPSYFDDIYIDDANFLGDSRVDIIKASGTGSHTGFTPSAGSNYQNVDETYFDFDTTYNSSSTLNTIDSYAMDNIATLGTIHAVAAGVMARKDDGGETAIQLLCRSNSTDYLSGTNIFVGDVYNEYQKIYEKDPATPSTAWTVANVNAVEFGLKVTDV